jgi:hypothetical protein
VGTHIDSFFPCIVERTVGAVLARLSEVFSDLADVIPLIRERGRFSADVGEWSVKEAEERIYGQGPAGFRIRVYSRVIQFTSLERFGALELPDQGIQEPLHRIFEAVASALGTGELAVAAGGFGDTDHAGDLAHDGESFAEVCRCLESVVGAPARSWQELESGAGQWYLRGLDAPFA